MKKLFTVLFVATAMAFVACGPSAEDVAKQQAAEKAKMDSIFNYAAQATPVDSTAAKPDSTATAPAEVK